MSMNRYETLPPISNHDDGLTNYRTDFREHPMERPFVHKPDEYMKPPGDMENMTSYKQEYVGEYKVFITISFIPKK